MVGLGRRDLQFFDFKMMGLRGQMEAIGSLNEVVGDLYSNSGTFGGQIHKNGAFVAKTNAISYRCISFVVYLYVQK